MNEQDLLLQRFIDQDLDPEEHLEFLETLNRDAALRERLLDMERVLAGAARLPRVAPERGFAAQLVSQLEPRPQGRWARVRERLLAPRVMEWNLATAMATACAAFVLTWLIGGGLLKSPLGPTSLQTAAPSQVVYVRVALLNPDAQSVTITGDFNHWDTQGIPLRKASNGLWTLTMPLKPGRYQYLYRVDGKWVTDPLASEFSPDGFGSENAVLDVRDLAPQHEERSS